MCNIFDFCENIVFVSGENFSSAAKIEIRTGVGGILVAEYKSLRIARADAIGFILDERFTTAFIYGSDGLLVTVVNPGENRSNAVKIMWGAEDHLDSSPGGQLQPGVAQSLDSKFYDVLEDAVWRGFCRSAGSDRKAEQGVVGYDAAWNWAVSITKRQRASRLEGW